METCAYSIYKFFLNGFLRKLVRVFCFPLSQAGFCRLRREVEQVSECNMSLPCCRVSANSVRRCLEVHFLNTDLLEISML